MPLQTIAGTLPMPLTSNNFMIKQFSQLQKPSETNDSELNKKSRLSLEVINMSRDSNMKTASSFIALKNNFIEELLDTKQEKAYDMPRLKDFPLKLKTKV